MKYVFIFVNNKLGEHFQVTYTSSVLEEFESWTVDPPNHKTSLKEPNGGIKYGKNEISFYGGPIGARKCVATLRIPGGDMSAIKPEMAGSFSCLWLHGKVAATSGKGWKWILKKTI